MSFVSKVGSIFYELGIDTKDFDKKIGGINKKLESVGKSMTKKVTLPIIAGMGLALKASIDFEEGFAGIRKTVDASEAEFAQLEDNIKKIASETPLATESLNKIGEMAGQLGVDGVDNLTEFIDTIAKIAVTTNLTEEEASTSFARIANIMQVPISEVGQMGSSVVDLGNNFATTESEIVTFANRIAGAGKTAGLSTADIFGIGTAFSSVGVQAERGGTAVSQTLFEMANAVDKGGDKLNSFAEVSGMTAGDFQKLFKEDAVAGFDAFIQGLGENGIKATGFLDELGLGSTRLQQSFISVAGAGGIMSDAIDTANTAFGENNALNEEAEKRFGTTASQLKIAKNNMELLSIQFGNELVPVLIEVLDKIMVLIDWFKDLSPETKRVILAIAGFVAVLGPLLIVTGKVITAVTTIGGLLKGMKGKVKIAQGAMKFLAGPAGGFALVAGAAVLAGIAIQNAFDDLSKFRNEARKSNENASSSSDLLIKTAKEKYASGEIDKATRDKMLESALIPVRARGGPVSGGSPYLVGENGPEMFTPNVNGMVSPNSSTTINGDIHIGSEQDADYFFGQLNRNQELSIKGLASRAGTV